MRPRSSMLLVALLIAAPHAAGEPAEATDALGDTATYTYPLGNVLDCEVPSVDILHLSGSVRDETLHVGMVTASELPTASCEGIAMPLGAKDRTWEISFAAEGLDRVSISWTETEACAEWNADGVDYVILCAPWTPSSTMAIEVPLTGVAEGPDGPTPYDLRGRQFLWGQALAVGVATPDGLFLAIVSDSAELPAVQ